MNMTNRASTQTWWYNRITFFLFTQTYFAYRWTIRPTNIFNKRRYCLWLLLQYSCFSRPHTFLKSNLTLNIILTIKRNNTFASEMMQIGGWFLILILCRSLGNLHFLLPFNMRRLINLIIILILYKELSNFESDFTNLQNITLFKSKWI